MIGRLLLPLKMVPFQGQAAKLRGCNIKPSQLAHKEKSSLIRFDTMVFFNQLEGWKIVFFLQVFK